MTKQKRKPTVLPGGHVRIALDEISVPGAVPVKIISDEVGDDGVRRITRQHGPIPIHPGICEYIKLLHRTMNDERALWEDRFEAARTIAPYFHPTFEVIQIHTSKAEQGIAS